MVYDASSKTSGPLLNECLYKGPKFRSYKVALIADVEKAFLMIAVDEMVSPLNVMFSDSFA